MSKNFYGQKIGEEEILTVFESLFVNLTFANLLIVMKPIPAYMPSEPHGEGDIAVELWKKLEPGEK